MPDTSPAALTAADFAPYFRAVHGVDPFPWQQALVDDVLTSGTWPDLVDVPTGLGKTCTIDVAVFVAAATVHHQGSRRLGRRRCFFVVDRRIIVDEAYEHATVISRALAQAEHAAGPNVLTRVAAGIRSYAPHAAGELLPVTRMRGGLTWAAAWLDRPDRPGIVLGTVDQVGSRLLFRGYGVSDRRRPIDAALTGTDALLLVDEAHLATALLSTVSAAQERDRLRLPLPGLAVTRLSATDTRSEHTVTLDVDAHRGDDEAWRRLTARKTLTLRESTDKACAADLAAAAQDQLATLTASRSEGNPAPSALVVCNTVDRARAVHQLLVKTFSARTATIDADCSLLIGRTRPADRPGLQDAILARFGIARAAATRAAVLVATQTVEVGVNLDADILITESASWDALVQRLGRLNRLGHFIQRFPDAGAATAVVVHDGTDDGLVYGTARDDTWHALSRLAAAADGQIDVSPLACRALNAGPLSGERLRRAATDVPVLLQPLLDAWVQTAPVPQVDPPIEPFLHGFQGGVAGVQVVWRDGLTSDEPIDDQVADPADEFAAERVDALLTQWPPRAAEIVEVPFHAVRQWLAGETIDQVSDLESTPDPDKRQRQVRPQFRALALRPVPGSPVAGNEPNTPYRWQWIDAGRLRPGDRIIVPAERGGLDQYGWSPNDQRTARDVSEIVTFQPSRSHRGGMLRLDAGLPQRLHLTGDDRAVVQEWLDELLGDDVARSDARLQELGQQLAELLLHSPHPESGWASNTWRRLRDWATSGQLRIIDLLDTVTDPSGIAGDTPVWARILTGPIPDATSTAPVMQQPDRDDEEAAASSVGTGPVTLAAHHAAVRRRAGDIAAALGLPTDLRAVVEDAAGWHDLGKVETRFQAMLHHGDAYEAALAAEPLAKSGLDPTNRQAWRHAARLSQLPAGSRHEAWSTALVDNYLRDLGDYPGDHDLLLHLIASHHGYARPWPRLVTDTAPRPITTLVEGRTVTVTSEHTVDLDQPTRFHQLNHRYGRWGLALLESIVRCADMTISAEGS